MKPAVLMVVFMVVMGREVSGDDRQQEALSNATSNFAQRLHQKIALDQKNIVFSPYSIHSLLTMVYLGARNETAGEMSQTLDLALLPGSEAHDAYRDLILELNTVGDVDLNVLNALYVKPNKTIEHEYIKEVQHKYAAKISHFNLTDPEGPEKEINDWVSRKTEHMIKETIPKGSIDASTNLILLSTICFNGTWQDPFDKTQTQKRDFTKADGSKIQVDMMNDTRSILLKKDDLNRLVVAEVPFKGGRFSLYVVKPNDANGLSNVEHLLMSPDMPSKLFEDLRPTYVELGLPKFKIETKLDLKDALKQMGLDKATTPHVADFSGISRDGDIFINKVLHQAVIDIQETGTVAAVVTVTEGKGLKNVPGAAEDTFIVDQPFMFFLWDNESEHIIFQGKVIG